MNLIIDLGQSGARIKVGESVLTSNIAKTSDLSVLQTIEKVLDQVPAGSYENVFFSLTGMNGEIRGHKEIASLCKDRFNSKNIGVMDDGFAAYCGALGDLNGVVLTLGGGVVAVSANNGVYAQTDGKGPIFGDLGGGFWIGQQGLRGALATLDGRESKPDLVELMHKEIDEINQLENKTGSEAALICIKAAKTVADGAAKGNVSALEILESGSQLLSQTIKSAWEKVQTSTTPYISILGGLTNSEIYVKMIQDKTKALIECEFVEAKGDHLMGAPLAAKLYPLGVSRLFAWVHF